MFDMDFFRGAQLRLAHSQSYIILQQNQRSLSTDNQLFKTVTLSGGGSSGVSTSNLTLPHDADGTTRAAICNYACTARHMRDLLWVRETCTYLSSCSCVSVYANANSCLALGLITRVP